MAQFTPNPAAEANLAFDTIEPGIYRMRVAQVKEEKKSPAGNTCVPVGLEFVDPSGLRTLTGGVAKNPGRVFDNGIIIAPADQQGKLRSLVEACGKAWGDISDVKDLLGCELDVKIKLDTYQGDTTNKVSRYIPVA